MTGCKLQSYNFQQFQLKRNSRRSVECRQFYNFIYLLAVRQYIIFPGQSFCQSKFGINIIQFSSIIQLLYDLFIPLVPGNEDLDLFSYRSVKNIEVFQKLYKEAKVGLCNFKKQQLSFINNQIRMNIQIDYANSFDRDDQNSIVSHFCQPQKNKTKIKDSTISFGQWTKKEIFKYFLFIYHHRQKFQTKSIRKSLKVFKQMSKFIKTRNSSQCRTHHQNLIIKARSLDNALNQFIHSHPTFLQKYENMKESLQILDAMDFCEDTSTVIREAKQSVPTDPESYSNESKERGVTRDEKEVDQREMDVRRYQEERIKKLIQVQVSFALWVNKISQLCGIREE